MISFDFDILMLSFLFFQVKMTKDHHLVSPQELESGKYDELIKDSFDPLICSKHEEPLKLYCCDASCCAPICTVCKTTPGHEGHNAIELSEQAIKESNQVQSLLPSAQRFVTATATKITNLAQEEKETVQVRKRVHKAINDRTEEIVEKLVKQVQDYAETLHTQVEELCKDHRKDVASELELCKNRLQAATSAKAFAEALLGFNRAEELVSMSREVRSRLEDFQKPVDTAPPGWKQPRLNPSAELDGDLLAKLFGEMTFEGEMMKSVISKTFSAKCQYDEKECALCDVCLDSNGNIVVVDRENRRIKVFDTNGSLIMLSQENALKSPNRVTILQSTQQILVKDEKSLRLLWPNGKPAGTFNDKLKQPVGIVQSAEGEVLVTEWMGGEVVGFDESGTKLRSFPCSCEAPGYITTSPNGNIIVSDWKQHVIKIFDSSGKFLRQFGQHGPGDGQLDHPYGVCTDKFNHIIISDTWNNRIVLLSEEGRFIKTILGKADGIEWPQSVVVDRDGRLVIVEQHGLIKLYQYIA